MSDVLLAGGTGALGERIARALKRREAGVRVLVRPGTSTAKRERLRALGAQVIEVAPNDKPALVAACKDVVCVVSALNGLEDTVIGTQGALLDAAVEAGVPRFIPSDFSLDFTKTPPGANRNLDLRRNFHRRLDAAPIQATSILNGAFANLLVDGTPIILFRLKRVLHWGDADQPLDFTSMGDTAEYTSHAALDADAPRILRIAGTVASAQDLARIAGTVEGHPYKTLRAGSIPALSTAIRAARALTPGDTQVFPIWQGLQYMRDMFSGRGKLQPLDNARYPGLHWTPLEQIIARRV